MTRHSSISYTAATKITAIGLASLVLFEICACSVDRREIARAISPDHRLAAILAEVSGGGAAGFINDEFYLNEQKYPPNFKEPILITSHCEPPTFTWLDDHTVQVRYSPPCDIVRFTNRWYLPSELAHGNAVTIEIILLRDELAQLSQSDFYKLYDPSSLVEVKTLHGLPEAVQTLLGAHATGYARIAEVGEECDPTDVDGNDAGRCFLVGGTSDCSALVAFKIGGYAGQSEIARAYAHTKSGWIMVKEWGISYPNNLRELKEMTSLPPEDYGAWKPK